MRDEQTHARRKARKQVNRQRNKQTDKNSIPSSFATLLIFLVNAEIEGALLWSDLDQNK